jgi:cell division protease FtsH
MALGVTQQLPLEDRHIYREDYINDTLVVRMGGRIAEELVFGKISTGACDDLVRSTELARKMVREWGMSDRLGPMAWGSQGPVFLGEELIHNREYSDETARVIDEEVARILVEQQDRCRTLLGEHRRGLDLVARALLEHETIDGEEVMRLVGLAADGVDIATVETRAADEALTHTAPEKHDIPAEQPAPAPPAVVAGPTPNGGEAARTDSDAPASAPAKRR